MTGITTTDARWRTRDILVAAVIGVAFGVAFWFWGAYVWGWSEPFFEAFKPAQYVISGVWLMPAVIAPLIVRKPGAALFAEIVAATVSALIGTQWGLDVLLSGFVQGAGAELVFAFGLYRAWGPLAAVLAGVGASFGEALHDLPIYFPSDQFGLDFQAGIVTAMVASGTVIAGLGGWYLVRALRKAGVLESFAPGT